MKKLRLLTCSLIFNAGLSYAQQTFMLPLAQAVTNDTENISVNNGMKNITGVVKPSIEVYLPEASKANGCAVILCPGGGMRALSWTTDVEQMAEFLTRNGIAAIGLKYRLNTTRPPQGMKMSPMVDVTGFEKFEKADANPAHYSQGDSANLCAAIDARNAIKMVRENAERWHINPSRVGYLGFSAGGGVAIAATITAKDKSEMPDFICSNYGPSLMPVEISQPLPPLLIMTRAEHPNVAAGLLQLFLVWKKAGGNAELHMYGDGRGPYYLMPQGGNTTTETWSTQMLQWLKAKGLTTK